jgi:3,4-dihydroxy 2-butanone 4-phosphate synthase/GTP cyclohydrolase II
MDLGDRNKTAQTSPHAKVTLRQKFGLIARNMSECSNKLEQFTRARLAVLQDDLGDRQAVIVSPAQEISATEVNRILHLSGGLTFVALSPERAAAFMLSPMARRDVKSSSFVEQPKFSQLTSVEAREGVSTGISAADRARTISILGLPHPQPRALIKPGHIFPVSTKTGGSLVKAEIPEAALDLVKLAGFSDAAMFVDLLDQNGAFITGDSVAKWAASNAIPLISISDLIRYRLIKEPLVAKIAESSLPTLAGGNLKAIVYRSKINDVEHLALVKGQFKADRPVLTRVQVENTVADVFGGNEPTTRVQISNALNALKESESGILLYLRRASLSETLDPRATALAPENHENAAPAGMREYGVGAQILRDLGVSQIELLSSTKRTLIGLDSFGITIVSQRAIPTPPATSLDSSSTE